MIVKKEYLAWQLKVLKDLKARSTTPIIIQTDHSCTEKLEQEKTKLLKQLREANEAVASFVLEFETVCDSVCQA